MNITPLTDIDAGWDCFRSHTTNLVYFVHSKCASSTYKELMKKLKWINSKSNEIDWSRDRVFSFIRNPLVKHRKGIVEFFFFNKNLKTLTKDIINNPDWALTLSNVAYFDHHSTSIYNMLGKNAELVTWIPIDIGLNNKQIVLDLLASNGEIVSDDIKNWFIDLKNVHEASPEKLAIFDLISSYPVPSHILRYLDYDDILYQHVIRNF